MNKEISNGVYQVLVISGKGGTGKTTLTAALAGLYKNIVVADTDVDAPDLHILLKPRINETEIFHGGKLAVIDKDKCVKCGRCRQICQFNAIADDYSIDPISCEGCRVCSWNCPADAIAMIRKEAGETFLSEVRCGKMVHALLKPGEENSGKLVSEVKRKARAEAEKNNSGLLLIDGPPGIGCPVIASLGGVDLALIVTEPTKSGMHDMNRVIKLAEHFKVPVKVVINKYDLNLEMTSSMEGYLFQKNIEVVVKMPFSENFITALSLGKTIIDHNPDSRETKIVKILQGLIGGYFGN